MTNKKIELDTDFSTIIIFPTIAIQFDYFSIQVAWLFWVIDYSPKGV